MIFLLIFIVDPIFKMIFLNQTYLLQTRSSGGGALLRRALLFEHLKGVDLI
jgi:hypothetical protein